VTHLRRMMLDELQRRNYAQNTVRSYIHAVEEFAVYFRKCPDQLGPEHIRAYQAHLFKERKLAAGTVEQQGAALRFFFVKTLHRPYPPNQIPLPKRQRPLPTVLSQDEVARLVDSARNLMHRAILMTLYSTGVRRAELCALKVADIDSKRMLIRIRHGKGGRDRDVLLSPKLLETLREYWRWIKPKTYLFPGMVNNWRADVPINAKLVWFAVKEAARACRNKEAGLATYPAALCRVPDYAAKSNERRQEARTTRGRPRALTSRCGIVRKPNQSCFRNANSSSSG